MDNKENVKIEFNNDDLAEIPAENKNHSHHHSSSHHHSHHHHHRSRSKKEKAKRFMKRNKYKIANGFVAALFVGILIVMGVLLDNVEKTNGNNANGSGNVIVESNATLRLDIPLFDEAVSLAGPAVMEYMNSDISTPAYRVYKKYMSTGRLDKGVPVKLSYEIVSIPDGFSVSTVELFVSENEKFSNSMVYHLSADETSVDVYNLKTNTQYYYKFVLSLSNGTKTSVEGCFKTADTPRMLSVDGGCNMRDIGGWKTIDGKIIKQGLLFRSAEIDGAVNSKYTVSAEGINTLLTVFGIRTDMDLRHESENPNGTDALGAGVKHNYYRAPMYAEAFTSSGKEKIRNIFSDLADKNNYPILIHCTHGMDRTGVVCYLLEAVLGVSEEDLMRDYQLSVMYHGNLWSENQMNEFIGQLKSYEGATIQQKAVNYLLSAGVTESEIASLKEIYLSK